MKGLHSIPFSYPHKESQSDRYGHRRFPENARCEKRVLVSPDVFGNVRDVTVASPKIESEKLHSFAGLLNGGINDKFGAKLFMKKIGLLSFGVLFAANCFAATITVGTLSAEAIQDKIDNVANAGDTLVLPSGSATFDTNVIVRKPVTIQGQGTNCTTITSGGSDLGQILCSS
jgi:hypothetical protein